MLAAATKPEVSELIPQDHPEPAFRYNAHHPCQTVSF